MVGAFERVITWKNKKRYLIFRLTVIRDQDRKVAQKVGLLVKLICRIIFSIPSKGLDY